MAVKNTSLNSIFKISKQNFENLLSKIEDLVKIDEKVYLSFDNESLFMYSFVGVNNQVHALKSHILPISEAFDESKIEKPFLLIVNDGKKFFKKISNFSFFEEDVDIKVIHNDDGYAEKILLKNNKLKIDNAGGLPTLITKSINIDKINQLLNIDKSLLNFDLKKEDYERLKKISTIDNTSDIYFINIKNNKISIGEGKWDLAICDYEFNNFNITFPKKYFNSVIYEKTDSLKVYIFETFVLLKSENANLMISTEVKI
jgi:hypothetical protein